MKELCPGSGKSVYAVTKRADGWRGSKETYLCPDCERSYTARFYRGKFCFRKHNREVQDGKE